MAQTTHPLHVIGKYRFPDDRHLLAYLEERAETITCTPTGLKYAMRHLSHAAYHRKWLYYAYYLVVENLDLVERVGILEGVLNCNLSQFSAIEVMGYAYRFGRNNSTKPLKNPRHIALWEAALKHHHKNNHHYPQGQPGHNMQPHNLILSILDMLASRMYRDLAGRVDSLVTDIFQLPDSLLERYTKSDRKKVEAYLQTWCAAVTSTPHRYNLALGWIA